MGMLIHNNPRPKKPKHKHDTPKWFLKDRFNPGALWQCECGKYFRLVSGFKPHWAGSYLSEEDEKILNEEAHSYKPAQDQG